MINNNNIATGCRFSIVVCDLNYLFYLRFIYSLVVVYRSGGQLEVCHAIKLKIYKSQDQSVTEIQVRIYP